MNVKTGKSVGKLINYSGQYGIGLMRMENIDVKNMIVVDSDASRLSVTTEIPKFWSLDDPIVQNLIKNLSTN